MAENGKKKSTLDGGRISMYFRGSINLNAVGTTLVVFGVMVLLWILVSGIFILGKG